MAHRFPFFLCLCLVGLILDRLPYQAEKVALKRIEGQLRQSPQLREEIKSFCGSLAAKSASPIERFFSQQLSPSSEAQTPICTVTEAHAFSTLYRLVTRWEFRILVQSPGKAWVKSFVTSHPTPLIFLPVAGFLLALFFQFSAWNMAWLLGSYGILLSGLDLKGSAQLVARNLGVLFTSDLAFLGSLLIGLWLCLLSVRQKQVKTHGSNAQIRFLDRVLKFVIGLWNPSIFSLLARVLYPAHQNFAKVARFLDLQSVAACLSLYLLFIDSHSTLDLIGKNFMLPRYLSFCVLFFCFLPSEGRTRMAAGVPLLRLNGALRWIIAIVALEILALRWNTLSTCPTVFRVGMALVLSELTLVRRFAPRQFSHSAVRISAMIVLPALIAAVSVDTGVVDLLTNLISPQIHPNALAFFTFLLAVSLSFVSGSFALAFFALSPYGIGLDTAPLVKAALLDGILAGTLLSPYSPLNLFPAVLYELPTQKIVAYRFRQLAGPLLIGTVIYALSHISSVAILQPVTFVFLCLVAVALQLRRNQWRLSALTT